MPSTCLHCGAAKPGGVAICPACGRSAAPRSGLQRLVPGIPKALPKLGSPGIAPSGPVHSAPGNIPAMLSYLVLPAVAFFFLEPYRRSAFVRFHAIQSLLFPVAAALLATLALMLATLSAFIGWIVLILVVDACAVLFVVMALKAYRGEAFRLPLLGDLAAQQAGLE